MVQDPWAITVRLEIEKKKLCTATSRVSIKSMHASGEFKNDTEELVYQCLVPREERMHVIEGN